MNILYTLNNNFFPQMLVSLESLIKYSRNKLTVYIICDEINSKNKFILKSLNSKRIKIILLGSPVLPKKLIKAADRGSISQFYRLFLDEIFQNIDVHRILYLDCDTFIINSNIEDLFSTDLGKNLLGATMDPWNKKYKFIFKLNPGDNMLNDGILLIDLDAWHKKNIEKVISNIIMNRKHFFQADQGILNEALHGHFKVIDPKFNVISSYYMLDYNDLMQFRKPINFYSKCEIRNAISHPTIIHFTSSLVTVRPWYSDSNHPYSNVWKKVFYRNHLNISLENSPTTLLKKLYKYIPSKNKGFILGILQCYIRPYIVKALIYIKEWV